MSADMLPSVGKLPRTSNELTHRCKAYVREIPVPTLRRWLTRAGISESPTRKWVVKTVLENPHAIRGWDFDRDEQRPAPDTRKAVFVGPDGAVPVGPRNAAPNRPRFAVLVGADEVLPGQTQTSPPAEPARRPSKSWQALFAASTSHPPGRGPKTSPALDSKTQASTPIATQPQQSRSVFDYQNGTDTPTDFSTKAGSGAYSPAHTLTPKVKAESNANIDKVFQEGINASTSPVVTAGKVATCNASSEPIQPRKEVVQGKDPRKKPHGPLGKIKTSPVKAHTDEAGPSAMPRPCAWPELPIFDGLHPKKLRDFMSLFRLYFPANDVAAGRHKQREQLLFMLSHTKGTAFTILHNYIETFDRGGMTYEDVLRAFEAAHADPCSAEHAWNSLRTLQQAGTNLAHHNAMFDKAVRELGGGGGLDLARLGETILILEYKRSLSASVLAGLSHREFDRTSLQAWQKAAMDAQTHQVAVVGPRLLEGPVKQASAETKRVGHRSPKAGVGTSRGEPQSPSLSDASYDSDYSAVSSLWHF